MISIQAIIAVRNSADTLELVLKHLAANQIAVTVIDHGSTDESAAIISRYSGNPITEVVREPFTGVFSLRRQMELKEKILGRSRADWVLHCDADEIHESPVDGESLRELIERCDAAGFDVLDCDEFVFCPADDDEDYVGTDYVKTMRRYYYFAPQGRPLHRVVRRASHSGGWSTSGGHVLSVEERQVAPEKIRLRHYIGLSMDRLRAQYLGRVFAAEELMQGWHYNRVPTTQGFVATPERSRLWDLDRDGWRKERPEQRHLLFEQEQPYKAPPLLSPSNHHKPLLFVVGVKGSGTEFLRSVLDAHPDIAIASETNWLRKAVRGLTRAPGDASDVLRQIGGEQVDRGASEDQLKMAVERADLACIGDILRDIYVGYAHLRGASRVGDSTRAHILIMHDIASILPEARFVHVIRDVRDATCSCDPGLDARDAATRWVWEMRAARQQALFLPHYLEIRYEEFVRDPAGVVKAIGDFIELPFDDTRLATQGATSGRLRGEEGRIESAAGVRQSYRDVVAELTRELPRPGQWQGAMAAGDIDVFERVAGDALRDLGYD